VQEPLDLGARERERRVPGPDDLGDAGVWRTRLQEVSFMSMFTRT
jgi:hypothetical protein